MNIIWLGDPPVGSRPGPYCYWPTAPAIDTWHGSGWDAASAHRSWLAYVTRCFTNR